MISNHVPKIKIGTKYAKPNWRFEAIQNPSKYGFDKICFTKPAFSKSLHRHASQGLVFQENKIPRNLLRLTSDFSLDEKELLSSIFDRYLKQNTLRKRGFLNHDANNRYATVAHLHALYGIGDLWLRKLFIHYLGDQGYPEIEYAVKLYFSEEQEEFLRYFGMLCFAGYDERRLAKEWDLPVSYAAALKNLFFDYSFLPKGRLSRLASLRQLVLNGQIPDEDFLIYKRIFDLGEIGVKAQFDFYSLTEDEQEKVKEYLKHSMVENTFKFQLSITNSKASKDYNSFVTGLAKLAMQKHELELLGRRNQLLEAQAKRINSAMDAGAPVMTDQDAELLESVKREMLLTEKELDFKGLHELK